MTTPRARPILSSPHLLGIEELSAAEIVALLDLSEKYVEVNRQVEKRHALLSGRTQDVNVGTIARFLAELGIDGTVRSEALDLEQHLRLSRAFAAE